MSDGSKPPLPRPPPPPAKALETKAKGHIPLPSSVQSRGTGASSPPFSRNILPPVPATPPAPKIPPTKIAPAPKPEEKPPAIERPVPAKTPEGAESKIVIAPSSGAAVKKEKPDERTSLLWHTGAKPIVAPVGAKPPFNNDEPFAEPLAQKPNAPGPASPRAKPVSEIPEGAGFDVDLGDLDTPMPGPIPEAAKTGAESTVPHFGEINSNVKLALEVLFKQFPDKKGPVELKGGKIFLNGKECGEISFLKSSGETLTIRLDKLGIPNSQLAANPALISKLGFFFNTLSSSFLVRACESNEYAAFTANSAGVRLSFYKTGADTPGTSFPLRISVEEENK